MSTIYVCDCCGQKTEDLDAANMRTLEVSVFDVDDHDGQVCLIEADVCSDCKCSILDAIKAAIDALKRQPKPEEMKP